MTHITGVLLKDLLRSAANHLQNNKKSINDLNVFPVPDGDTGTNMSRTFSAAVAGVCDSKEENADSILSQLATLALRNARGNSGVILSQILRGAAKGAEDAMQLGVAEIASSAASARDTAYRAIMKPTEGTILTVVREIAEFAEEHFSEYQDADKFLKALLDVGQASLDNTPEILPVLKQAGVVDAGGQGVITLLEGACLALDGKAVVSEEETEPTAEPRGDLGINTQNLETSKIKYLYCTEFIIHKKPKRGVAQFTAAIQAKGDCMLVIEDEDIVKVHIHTNHPGYVLEQAVKIGELTDLKIDNMKYQHDEKIGSVSPTENIAKNTSSNSKDKTKEKSKQKSKKKTEPLKKFGKVCVSSGDGLTGIFASLGADTVVEGGQTMNPSTQDLLSAVESVSAEIVFLFPNNKNIILAAGQVQELTKKKVIVIPTTNAPQCISALAVFDETVGVKANKSAMSEAMQTVKCSHITFAARDSVVNSQQVKKGQIMGVSDSGIQAVGDDMTAVCSEVLDSMVDEESGGIFIYFGEDVKPDEAESLRSAVEEKYPDLDVALYNGGQPVYYYILSVE